MIVGDSVRTTCTLQKGDSLRHFFRACAECSVIVLPVVDEQGQIFACVHLDNVLSQMMLPDYVLKAAHVLGDDADALHELEPDMQDWAQRRIDDYLTQDYTLITPDSSLAKALALMEAKGLRVLFVVNEKGYLGVLSRITIAKLLVDRVECSLSPSNQGVVD